MKQERKFLRQCCSCKEYKNKEELIRLTRDYKTGEVIVNSDNCVQGRSVYICKNEECVENVIKKKKSLYSLRAQTTENIKKILRTVLKS